MTFVQYILPTLAAFWLLGCSWQDSKKKSIPLLIILLGFILLCIPSLILYKLSLWSRMMGLGLGIILLLISLITKGQIGTGDGLVLCILGLSFGFSTNVLILLTSLFLSAIVSVILLSVRKVTKKTTIPFVPFIFIGYLGVLVF